nr:iron-sulfur cluster formation ABC transporter ATP-binding subunit [Cyanidiaceae sp.]
MKKPYILKIQNLTVEINEFKVLNNINLQISRNETHAIMGPNGSGKSSLLKVIAGHPSYKVVEGKIFVEDIDITQTSPEERSNLGLFLGFQYPIEIMGVNNADFLRAIYNQKRRNQGLQDLDPLSFLEILAPIIDLVAMDQVFLHRNLNEGFSGGEKKKNEILQMILSKPKLAILDEPDSGLDIDALKSISQVINKLRNQKQCMLIVTHYQHLLDYVIPDKVHVMHRGRIIQTGDIGLATQLRKRGYKWISQNLN